MKQGTDPDKPRFLLSINDPLPVDTKLVSANIASKGKSIFMVIESESFEISGQKIPQHLPIPTVTAHYLPIPEDKDGSPPPHVTNATKEEQCTHYWEDLPRESSLVEHDQVCSKCGLERDMKEDKPDDTD